MANGGKRGFFFFGRNVRRGLKPTYTLKVHINIDYQNGNLSSNAANVTRRAPSPHELTKMFLKVVSRSGHMFRCFMYIVAHLCLSVVFLYALLFLFTYVFHVLSIF